MRRFHLSIAIFSGFIIIIMLIFAFCIDLSSSGTAYSGREDIVDGWTDQSVRTVSLSRVFEKDSPDINSFTHEIDGSTLNGRGLCLVTHNINFTVSLGGETIYEFYPQLGGIYGMRYGEAVHTIDLPSFTGNRTLTIKAESLRSDGMSGCNELYLQSIREFVHSIIHSEVVKLGLCIITFFFGVLLFIVGIIEDKLSGKMLEPVCLGATTLIVSAWIGSQTLVMRLLSHNPAMLRAMEYLALCVLPIPVLMFYSSITKNPKNKAVIAAVIAAEKELRKRTSGQVLFVHFDVNFLKKVNDEYGHAEGDRHLKATAKVLSDSFADSRMYEHKRSMKQPANA